MTTRSSVPLALAALACALAPSPAPAWSEDGHRVIAAVAEERLSPAARALVREIAGGPLDAGDVATWADAQRSDRTRAWHYVNIAPGAGRYDAARDCPGGACVVAAITRFEAELRERDAAIARGDALRWLVHLVADVHQPLHAGTRADRGGNDVPVRLRRGRGQPTNLHALWDGFLVEPLVKRRTPREAARALLAGLDPAQARAWAEERDPAAWADASHALARAIVADQRTWAHDGVAWVVPPGYRDARRPEVERALLQAGVRLAAALDRIAAARAARR